jgi:hypothetical protein
LRLFRSQNRHALLNQIESMLLWNMRLCDCRTGNAQVNLRVNLSSRSVHRSLRRNNPIRAQPFSGCCAARRKLRRHSPMCNFEHRGMTDGFPSATRAKTDNADTKTGSSDLPVGRFVDRRVESLLQKYFGFHTPQITSRTFRIPSHTEGRFAIVTDVGAGCGGRGSVLRATGSQGGFP